MAVAAQRQLANAFQKLKKEPVEGFAAELKDDSNLFEWRIFLEGPKDTPYEGGVFQAVMKFPPEYPMLPPSLTFTSDFWHPNVYADGRVCISILHPPGEDEMSGELAQERWLPTQTVGTILLSVISMLNDPNTSSAANVDASKQLRENPKAYEQKCRALAKKSLSELPPGIIIPHPDTNPEERKQLIDSQKVEDEFNLYDDSESDFVPESDDDGSNEVCSAFYESDNDSDDAQGVFDDSPRDSTPVAKDKSEKLELEKIEEEKSKTLKNPEPTPDPEPVQETKKEPIHEPPEPVKEDPPAPVEESEPKQKEPQPPSESKEEISKSAPEPSSSAPRKEKEQKKESSKSSGKDKDKKKKDCLIM